jgi:hypothetical protein
MRNYTFHENIAGFKTWALVAKEYCIKTNFKTNEIRRRLAVLLFTAISLSNGEAL